LIPCMNDPLPHTPDGLLGLLRRLSRSRLGRSVVNAIHRSTLTADGNLKLNRKLYRIYSQPDNDSVAQLLERHPRALMGWIFLNPRASDNVLDELERYRHVPGMVGLKLHPHWHDYPIELARPLLARANDLALPVLIHLGHGDHGDYRSIAESYPRIKLICAHAGIPFYDELWKYAQRRSNLYVDLSSPYLNEDLVRAAVKVMGPQRCLYGTDSPYGFQSEGSYDYGHIRGWVERLPISEAERAAIFSDNFLQILSAASVEGSTLSV
jgi:predicted TIM-barrel fold metal-dependent hydrolase